MPVKYERMDIFEREIYGNLYFNGSVRRSLSDLWVIKWKSDKKSKIYN